MFAVLRTHNHRIAALATATCLALAACGDRGRDDAAVSDSALARDLTLASAIATPPPALQDGPETAPPVVAEREVPPVATPARAPTRRPSRPVRQEPQPEPEPQPAPEPVVEAPEPEPTPEPAPAPVTPASAIAAGTTIGLTIGERACSDANRPGDKMVAETAEAVTGANGRVFPAGSTVVLEVATVERDAGAETATITFRVKSITTNGETYPIAGDVVPTGALERRRVESGGSDKKKVIGGAILGAIIGRVAGGDTRGAVVGAAAGAAVGTAAAGATSRYETCVPAGASLRLVVAENGAIGY
jgi:outer membrane biosynthesis protein TonB